MAGLPKGGYGIVGRMAMRSDKVSKEAKAVYALLCSYTGGKHYCYPSVETLAKDLQTSTRTIIRLTEELKAHGFARKIKVGKDKRKTAYIPLHPYGGIGAMDDTYLEEIDDTDDTQIGDTHGTVIITSNNNKESHADAWTPPFLKDTKTSKRKPKAIVNHYPEIQSLLNILSESGEKLSTISQNMRRLMYNAVELHGLEFCERALRGRIIQASRKGAGLSLSAFFDPEAGQWMSDCAKLVSGQTVQAERVLTDDEKALYDEMQQRLVG
jgi:hypothetical protein